MTATATAPAEILRDAADYIEKNGWCQRIFYARDGRACALGALGALRLDRHSFDELTEACRAVNRRVGDIIDWNDAPGRTKDEVIATLRSIADELDGKDAP